MRRYPPFQRPPRRRKIQLFPVLIVLGITATLVMLNSFSGMGKKSDETKENYTEAANGYRQAADKGDAEAQYNLSLFYASGKGVKMDHAEALKWLNLAAEQGHAKAQFKLASMYYNGRSVGRNLVEAYKWSTLAGNGGVKEALELTTAMQRRLSSKDLARAQTQVDSFTAALAKKKIPVKKSEEPEVWTTTPPP